MASVEKVQQRNYQKPFLNSKNTGYLALGSIGVAAASSIITPVKKYHMPLGIIALGSAVLHLATILNYNKKTDDTQIEFMA